MRAVLALLLCCLLWGPAFAEGFSEEDGSYSEAEKGPAEEKKSAEGSDPLRARHWKGAAEGPQALVIGVKPKAEGKAEGKAVELKDGDKVGMGSTVLTDESGEIVLILPDKSKLALGPESEAVLSDFVDTEGGESLNIKIDQGLAAFVSGELAKRNDRAILLETPQASVGVRGTTFEMQVGENETLVFLDETAGPGVIVSDRDTGASETLDKPDNVVEVSKGRISQRKASKLERDLFRKFAKILSAEPRKDPMAALSARYEGTWKTPKATFLFKYANRKGTGILQKTISGPVSFTLGKIARQVRLAEYPGNSRQGIKSSDGMGVEVEVTDISFPTLNGQKKIGKAFCLISPETGTGQIRASAGRNIFEIRFQIQSADSAYATALNSGIGTMTREHVKDARGWGACVNPQETIFER